MKLYQQGDVLFKTIDKIPENAKEAKAKNGRYVVAEGEVTGHSHTLAADSAVKLFETAEGLFLSASKPSEVVHEEHGKITIPAGTFKIDRVKEYDHFAEEARQVRD